MEVKPGYKQTEVGVIPEDWGVSTVGAEFSIQLGKMLDAEKNVGVPKPFLGNRAVQWGRIDLTDIGEIKLSPSDLQRFHLRKGDLLVCEGGEIGRAAVWQQPIEECYYQKALHRLRPIRGYNVQLMFNMLQRLASTGFLLNFVTQTSIAHLPKDKFETVPIPLPPTKAEQEAIAEALSDADALIESLEQLLVKKRQLKQGAMQELLTGKKRLPGFSGEWEVKRLGEICHTTTGKKDVNEGNPEGQYPFFTCSRSHTFSDSYSFDTEAILIAGNGDVGNLHYCSGKFEAYQRTYVLSDFSSNVHYLWQQLNAYLAESLGLGKIGSSIPYIKKENIVSFSFHSPQDEAEQSAIATILSDMDTEITSLEAKLAKAHSIKQGMMQELLTGRIRLV